MALMQAQAEEAYADFPDRIAGVAVLATAYGFPETAARLFGAAESRSIVLGEPSVPPLLYRYEGAIRDIRSALGEERYTEARGLGRSLSLQELNDELRTFVAALASKPVSITEAAKAGEYGLTRRELDVLRLLVTGRSNREIATELFISVPTVKVHVGSILNKFGVDRTAGAPLLPSTPTGLTVPPSALRLSMYRNSLLGPAKLGLLAEVSGRDGGGRYRCPLLAA